MQPSPDTHAETDLADDWFRPVWEIPEPAPRRLAGHGWIDHVPALLVPLCAAQDALARLDQAASLASAPVRGGLVARLALREAAGWLAHASAWIHPLDLGMHAAQLTSALAPASWTGHASTFPNGGAPAHRAGAPGLSDAAVARALELARLWQRLATRPSWRPLADLPRAQALLDPLAASPLDPRQLAQFLGDSADPADLPPLLAAAAVAQGWMDGPGATPPDSLTALAAAACRLQPALGLTAVALPFWAAYPTRAHGDPDALPRLRHPEGQGGGPNTPSWPLCFLRLVREAAQAGRRELTRLQDVAAAGAQLVAGDDRRARRGAVLQEAVRTPVLTAATLARALRLTPQTATQLLRELQATGLLREITGRKSFRAWTA